MAKRKAPGRILTAAELEQRRAMRVKVRPAVMKAANRVWHISVGHMVKDPTTAELAEIARVRAAKAGG